MKADPQDRESVTLAALAERLDARDRQLAVLTAKLAAVIELIRGMTLGTDDNSRAEGKENNWRARSSQTESSVSKTAEATGLDGSASTSLQADDAWLAALLRKPTPKKPQRSTQRKSPRSTRTK